MHTQQPFVITVSREVGSGGHTVGSILAEKLNVRYLDKQLISSLQKQFNLTAGAIEKLKGKKKNWLTDFIDKITPMPPAQAFGLDPKYVREFRADITTDDVFEAELEILKGLADMGSCVIAGRSGFFVFKNHPNTLNVFITASKDYRINRIMTKQGLSEKDALKVIKSIDKARENYIRRYAGVSRYDARNYDIALKADGHSEEELAELILSYIG
ncbi:MAG: cytidylate kinase-like family protein [Bacteroidales bacterium]|nr:cytidylate kinase-like family protein [Bacteroidales bacterium]